jgi:hypothetical protein
LSCRPVNISVGGQFSTLHGALKRQSDNFALLPQIVFSKPLYNLVSGLEQKGLAFTELTISYEFCFLER